MNGSSSSNVCFYYCFKPLGFCLFHLHFVLYSCSATKFKFFDLATQHIVLEKWKLVPPQSFQILLKAPKQWPQWMCKQKPRAPKEIRDQV